MKLMQIVRSRCPFAVLSIVSHMLSGMADVHCVSGLHKYYRAVNSVQTPDFMVEVDVTQRLAYACTVWRTSWLTVIISLL